MLLCLDLYELEDGRAYGVAGLDAVVESVVSILFLHCVVGFECVEVKDYYTD